MLTLQISKQTLALMTYPTPLSASWRGSWVTCRVDGLSLSDRRFSRERPESPLSPISRRSKKLRLLCPEEIDKTCSTPCCSLALQRSIEKFRKHSVTFPSSRPVTTSMGSHSVK